jgi:hypothetical protein
LKCLQYAHENGCPWDKDTCRTATIEGSLECLKYAHENGCPLSETIDIWIEVHNNGHLRCLKYANENGYPWYQSICVMKTQNLYTYDLYTYVDKCKDSLECLKYIHENGCPLQNYLSQTKKYQSLSFN